MKKILVIGNGGRENSICKTLKTSSQNIEIYNVASDINPGIKKIATKIVIGNSMDNEFLKKIASEINPDFAIIGPDDPIGNGATDALAEIGIKSFAPTKKCAQLESSKSFTRNLLKKHAIEGSPEFFVSTDLHAVELRKQFYEKFSGKIVVKSDGLLGGKGVLVAGDHFTEFTEAENFALKSIEKFGRVVLEEKIEGPEFSIIYIVDGKTVLPTPVIQDYKRAFEGDTGPNTGGMGTVSDENNSLPFLNNSDLKKAYDITKKTMKALQKETDEKYVGIMYGGFMKTKKGIQLIEYNSRFGDPETFNILPLLQNDFVEICERSIDGTLSEMGPLSFEKKATVVKYLCPQGYPTNSVKNVPLHINPKAWKMDKKSQEFFTASIGEEKGEYKLKGSRAIAVLGKGKDWEEANTNCDAMIKNFSGPIFHRKDIGTSEYWTKKTKEFKNII